TRFAAPAPRRAGRAATPPPPFLPVRVANGEVARRAGGVSGGRRPSSPARGPPLRSGARVPPSPRGRREAASDPSTAFGGPLAPRGGRIRRAGVFRRGRRRLGRGRSVRGFARRALS